MKFIKFSLHLVLVALLSGCGGGGGGGSSSASSSGAPAYVDSWPIYPALSIFSTSYENKFDSRINNSAIEKIISNVNPVTVTFGDFFQEGQMSAFVVANRAGNKGFAYFLRWKSSESKWVDDSARLLGNGLNGNRDTCVNSKYAITGDFNGDGKPDVFLSCGMDTQAVEQPIFLSQINGSYLRRSSGIRINGRSASASHIDGDSRLDLIVSNLDTGIPEVWVGDGHGGFTSNAQGSTGRLISSGDCGSGNVSIPPLIQTTAIVNVGGRKDLILANSSNVAYLLDLGTSTSSRYSICSSAMLALATSAEVTDIYATTTNGGGVSFYLNQKNTSTNPQSFMISKYSLNQTSHQAVTHYSLTPGTRSVGVTANFSDGLSELMTVKNNAFKAFDAGCSALNNRCNWSVNLVDVY